jgi:hypothetical protein
MPFILLKGWLASALMKISDLYLPYMAEDCYLASPPVPRFHIRTLRKGDARELGCESQSHDVRQMTDLS